MNIVAFSKTTIYRTILSPHSLFSELVLTEIGILGEGYIDLNTAEDFILSFVQVLADCPQEVTVKKIDGDPTVFEITVSSKDLVEVSSKEKAIRVIAGYSSGLTYNQFVLKYIER